MSTSPNRSRVDASGCSSSCGTVLGRGTIGLGESFGKATDKQIEEEGMRAYWSKWERTKEEWQRADEGRNRKVIETLNMERAKKTAEASRARDLTIMRMQQDRKANEEARRIEAEKEAEEQRKVNEMVADMIRREREEGIKQRRENRLRELEEIHKEREMLLEVSALDREAEELAKRAHIEEMRRWHQASKEKAREEAERRLKEKQETVHEIKEGKVKREKEAKAVRQDIVKAKSTLVKTIASTHDNGRQAVIKTSLQRTKQSNEMRSLVQKEKVIATQRKQETLEEKSKLVKELQERTRAAREQYEDECRRQKEELKQQVAAQKEAARRLKAIEEQERAEEYAEHIANVRALVNRRRTESRIDTSSPNSRGRRTVSPGEDEDASRWN